jgi:hypothetical protein
MKKTIAITTILILLFMSVPVYAEDSDYWDNPYTDFPEHTINNDVAWATINGVVNGYPDSTFDHLGVLTRSMFIKMVYRYEAPTKDAPFADFDDVPAEAWYADSVAWAKENGIVIGVGDRRFAPDEAVTVPEISVIVYRYAQYKGLNLTFEINYVNIDRVPTWSQEAVKKVSGVLGIGTNYGLPAGAPPELSFKKINNRVFGCGVIKSMNDRIIHKINK